MTTTGLLALITKPLERPTTRMADLNYALNFAICLQGMRTAEFFSLTPNFSWVYMPAGTGKTVSKVSRPRASSFNEWRVRSLCCLGMGMSGCTIS